VGGVVLPLLGAVPDGAIMLFSGIGNIETAQETLSVGIGALAGSTIMLLTVPWALSVLAGAVNLKQDRVSGELSADYKDKKNIGSSFAQTGVGISKEIKHAATIMVRFCFI
jgi:Ca2+/Na+ antiporter